MIDERKLSEERDRTASEFEDQQADCSSIEAANFYSIF